MRITRNHRSPNHWYPLLHVYVMVTYALGIAVFLFAFFPVKNYVTNDSTDNYTPDNNESDLISNGDRIVDRLVVMVIDALRSDFVLSPEAKGNMPYLSSLLERGKACVYTATVNPPTVTMPRIKAMMTGTVPAFVDIILNLGSPQITEDNLLHKLVESGRQAVFYGDDTWLKLFPNTFVRSEGTTSFFVSDYTEVDMNVTRHLSRELDNQDWSLMILHYLGLDHIGHLIGPYSSLVPPKLLEMDSVGQQIHEALQRSKQNDVLVICGDHGMKDSGGHGGASQEETQVAVAVLGLPCLPRDKEIAQLDLAPTLSVLLGLPVPDNSVGTLVPELMIGLSPKHRLRLLSNNAAHLATLLADKKTSSQEGLLLDVKHLHNSCLTQCSRELYSRVEAMYVQVSADMSVALSSTHSHFDLHTLTISYILVLQCMLIALLQYCNWPRVAVPHFVLIFIGYVGFNACVCTLQHDRFVQICDVSKSSGIVLHVVFMSLLSYNTLLLYHCRTSFNFKVGWRHPCDILLAVGCGLQCLGLGSSSLVEEEHQVWYFLWTSLLLLLLPRDPWRATAVLVLHRIARKWNQSGDKWASVPDVEDWLAESKFAMSFIFLAGLLILAMVLCRNQTVKCQVVTVVACCCVYSYRAATGAVHLPFLMPVLSHHGWVEARVFGLCLVLLLTQGMLASLSARSAIVASATLHNCWLLAVTMLRRPADVILLPVQLFFSSVICRLVPNIPALAMAHVWLSGTTYFYQGNSNSLASIDVAAGYVGLLTYQPGVIGCMLLAHTYSAPILSHLALLRHLISRYRSCEISLVLQVVTALRLVTMAVYLGIMLIQREHLFIWSVFAPKLLYEITATFICLLSVFLSLPFTYLK